MNESPKYADLASELLISSVGVPEATILQFESTKLKSQIFKRSRAA